MKVLQLVDAGDLCVSGSSIDRTFFSLFPEFEDLVGNLVVKVLQEVNQHKLTIQLRLLKIMNDTASLNNSSVVSNVYTPTIPHLNTYAASRHSGIPIIFVVFAMTDPHLGNHGISAFIVEKGFPGFSIGKHEKKMGIRGSATSDLIFEDCIVPKENMLGKEGKGFKVAMGTLDGGRVGVAAQAMGIAEGAIEETVKYTKERMQFKKRISQFQNTQFQLADMKTRADAAQLLVYRAAAAKDAGDPNCGFYSAMAKLFASETASDVTRRAVQLFGGYGYTREYPVERMMRDAKITEIYEGTSEVQRMVISSHLGVK